MAPSAAYRSRAGSAPFAVSRIRARRTAPHRCRRARPRSRGERTGALVVVTAPGDRTAEITSFRMGLRRGERFRAPVERLPVRQPRTCLLHVHRIPPLLDRDHAGLTEIDGLAGRERRLHRILAGGLPHLHRDVQIAGLQARELRDVVGLHVFDVVAHLVEHRAHDVGRDVLAGPVMDGELDRVLRLHGRGRGGAGEHRHSQHRHREISDGCLHRLHFLLSLEGAGIMHKLSRRRMRSRAVAKPSRAGWTTAPARLELESKLTLSRRRRSPARVEIPAASLGGQLMSPRMPGQR